MKKTQKHLLFNISSFMKQLHKHFSCFGSFYRKHWKLLVSIKFVILIVVLTFSFSVRKNSDKVVRHGGAPIYADNGLCGNAVCDSIDAYCGLSSTNCSMVPSLSDCSVITGCTVKTVERLSCAGTTFSCSSILNKGSCEKVGCARSGDDAQGTCSNDNGKGGHINELCSGLSEFACKEVDAQNAGDCSWQKTSSDMCVGEIASPEDENACTSLKNIFLIYKIGISTTRYPAYSENETSCPDDCSTTLCGNSVCENTSAYCDLSTTDCTKFNKDSCTTLSGCSLDITTIENCEGTTFVCGAIEDETMCNTMSCLWDPISKTCSKPAALKDTCGSLNPEQCTIVDQNDLGTCTLLSKDIETCEGKIDTPTKASNCIELDTIFQPFGFFAIRYPEYIETSDTCPDDCNAAVCGNGQIEGDEECDDGNTQNGDGCKETCVIEELGGNEKCGNGMCDDIVAACVTSNSSCKNIDLSICNEVNGCSPAPIYEYVGCSGTLFSCQGITEENICTSVGCNRTDDVCVSVENFGGGGGPIPEMCDTLSQEQCEAAKQYSIGDCSVLLQDNGSVCDGTILTPTSKDECSFLHEKLISYGYSFTWSDAYSEDIFSCPTDCNVAICGDGQVEGDEECDDGNVIDGDDCSQNCYQEPSCSLSMTGATNESPFVGYFSYELYGPSAVDYVQFDETTTGDIENPVVDPDVIGTFTHEYNQIDIFNSPTLYVYNKNHPELTNSCSVGNTICTPFSPDLCGSGALGNRGFQCSDIPASECMFLIQIYEATSGANWDNNDGWLQDPKACKRHGVDCITTEDGKFLASLDLSDNNLQGPLPATIDLFLPYLFPILEIDTRGTSTVLRDVSEATGANELSGRIINRDKSTGDAIYATKSADETGTAQPATGIAQSTKYTTTGTKYIITGNTTETTKSTNGESLILGISKRLKYTSNYSVSSSSYSGVSSSTGDLGLDFSFPFIHFVTLDLSHNHLIGTIPMGYTILFPMLQTLDLSYNKFSSVFGDEPLISMPKFPGYNEYTALADGLGYTEMIESLNNISFTSPGNFRPYFVFNFTTQRFDLDHGLLAAFDYDGLDTLSTMANIMGLADDAILDIWAYIYNYYHHSFSLPTYMSSIAEYAFGISQELSGGFVDLFKDIGSYAGRQKTDATTKKFSWNDLGDILGKNTDILENILPLITSSLQVATNMFNHLQTVDFSHNEIVSVPKNLPINACVTSFDLSYNQLNGELPFVSYFGYNKGPIAQTQKHEYTVVGSSKLTTTSDFYLDLVKGSINLQTLTYLKYNTLLTGTTTGITINDETVTTIITNHGSFQSQIVIPDTIPGSTGTIFGKNCKSSVNGAITCVNLDCKPDDPKCTTHLYGQYVGIFAVVDGDSYSSVCAYSGSTDGVRRYNPDTMVFDKNNICTSLGMIPLYDFNILRETVGEPICERQNNTITVDFSHNQLIGSLPEIITTNSTTWNELNGLDTGSIQGPLRLFLQSSTPLFVKAHLNDNNLTDNGKPASRSNINAGQLANNCLTRENILEETTTYLNSSWNGWNVQRICDLPWITYSPDQEVGQTDSSVTATVHLPSTCKINNNNGKNTYTFESNGAFAFEVSCQKFERPRFLIGKVNRINSNTVILVNAKDFSENVDIYNNNTKNTDIDATQSFVSKKKIIAKSSMNTIRGVQGADNIKVNNKILTTNNLNFINDPKIYNPLVVSNSTGAKKISVDIPDNAILKEVKNNKTSDYTRVFYAPEDFTQEKMLKEKFLTASRLGKTISIIHVGSKIEDSSTADSTVIAKDVDTEDEKTFTITIETDEPVGTIGKIFSSQDGDTRTYYGTSTVILSGSTKMFSFTTPHLTYFGIGVDGTGTTTGTTQISVGNRGVRLVMDTCPHGDYSPSYYDNACGSAHGAATCINDELTQAYTYAFDNNITALPIDQLNLCENISRKEVAMMISVFAENVLGRTPDTTKKCSFTDITKESASTKYFIQKACQLGLMGMKKDGITPEKLFHPNRKINRAEFGTIFSRLLYGTTYSVPLESSDLWYSRHLQALKNKGIMTVISSPKTLLETRGYIMIMMQRAGEGIYK